MGEVMIQFNPIKSGPLKHVSLFEKHVAGSESNVAIGLKRLGMDSGIITAVGNDEFGKNILMALKSEDIDTATIKVSRKYPTGIYFVERNFPIPNHSNVFYYRNESAMSHLQPSFIKKDFFNNIDLFHVSGITPLLSGNCEKASNLALKFALESNIFISFDTNIRRKLVKNADKDREKMRSFIEHSDIIFTGKGDLRFLTRSNLSKAEELLRAFFNKFSVKKKAIVVIKVGAKGALAWDGVKMYHQESLKMPTVDTIGAGDAFDAAFLATFIKEFNIKKSLKVGVVAGAMVTGITGDYEAFPTEAEIELAQRYSENENDYLR